MILQLGALFSSVLGGAPGASLLGVLGGVVSRGASLLAPIAVSAGGQFVNQLVNRELNRSSRNDFEDAIKAQLRAAVNAVSPTAAPGQGPVFSGGPATGPAFSPPTLLPPSIQPPNRILQTDPAFFGGKNPARFQTTRRPPDVFVGEDPRLVFPGGVDTTNVMLGGLVRPLVSGAAAAGRFFRSFGASGSRRMGGLRGTAVAGETAAAVALGSVFDPGIAHAPGISAINLGRGPALQLTENGMPHVSTEIPTGLPRTGNFQREANGCIVQWYFWDGDMGTQPAPIDRGQSACLKRDCIYRLNVFTGKFVKLKGRRMNPMNVRAFFRAGRRVDSGERICRKMFSEHRKTKTGTIRRKRSRKKK